MSQSATGQPNVTSFRTRLYHIQHRRIEAAQLFKLETVAGSSLTLSPSQSLQAKSVTEGRSKTERREGGDDVGCTHKHSALAAQTIEPCPALEPGGSSFCMIRVRDVIFDVIYNVFSLRW
jgi:hypothetical protein